MGALDEAKGKAKEAAGSVTGSDDLRHEGQAQQRSPYEVGSWIKSIVSDNASLSVSARGPVSLETVSITNGGVRHTQDFAIDASHAVATVDLADVPAADLQVVMLTQAMVATELARPARWRRRAGH